MPTTPSTTSEVFPLPGPAIYALRTAFAVGGRLAPGAAARAAEGIFCRPPKVVPRPPEPEFLAAAVRGEVGTRQHRIATYTWESDGPTVLLLHGWGSYAGRWHMVGTALQAAGFRLVALDGPAHGASSGRWASLPEFAEALATVAAAERNVHAVVGHSLGAAAIPVAAHFKGLTLPRAVLVAPPAHPARFADALARYLWWPRGVQRRMTRRIERRLGHVWDDFEIPVLARGRTEPALLLHDADDAVTPASDSRAIHAAWRGSVYEETRGLGHRAILRDPAVAARITAFLAS